MLFRSFTDKVTVNLSWDTNDEPDAPMSFQAVESVDYTACTECLVLGSGGTFTPITSVTR
jgi:hypothetical protein